MVDEAQTPSTLNELREYLKSHCYQPSGYHVGSGWRGCADTHCIEKTDSGFVIFYVERGQRYETIEAHEDEATACRAFLNTLDQDRWSKAHCVAWSTSIDEINRITRIMEARGIQPKRNDIPAYAGPNDPRYRLFVFGRDKLAVDAMIRNGDIPPLRTC